MDNSSRQKTKRSWRDMTERQMETVVAIGAVVLLVIIITFLLMFRSWGVAGTFWRLFGIGLFGVGVYLAWRHRGKIASYIETRRQESAARAAAAAEALAAAEAKKPRPLQGQFPTKVAFFGPGTSLVLDRGTLESPLVYAVAGGVDLTSEPSLIASGHIVAPPKGQCGEPLPYWPSYHSASPSQRSVYLQWLLSGRRGLPPEIGYAFMYFYGLERRALVDRHDLKVIINEVIRLRELNLELHPPNRSFGSYTNDFLWFLAVAYAGSVEESSIEAIIRSCTSWNEENLSAALGWYIEVEKPLPALLALELTRQLPGAQQSVVVDRVSDEFRDLFTKRYAEKFGEGMMVRSSKRRRTYQYKTASAALGLAKMSDGPNPLGLMSQFKSLIDLWNECVDALRRFSSVVQRDGQETLTPKAWEALPDDMRAKVEHPLQNAVCRLIQESTDNEGRTLIDIRRLAKALCWEVKDRCNLSESKWISQTLEECGYCMEPDARLTGRAYKPDEIITAFLRWTDLQMTTTRYAAAACMLQLGMFVAAADGEIHPDEVTVLLRDLENMFELNEHEQRRLGALRTLITTTGPDLAGLTRMTKQLKPSHREAIGKLLLALAAEDGVVTKEELKAIKKCYKKLGFSQDDVERAVDTLRGYQHGEEPVTIRPAMAAEPGEAIPRPDDTAVLRLDRQTIAQIMRDTREVANLLAEAMDAGEQPGEKPFTTPFVQPSESVVVSGGEGYYQSAENVSISEGDETDEDVEPVPSRYASLYQLLVTKQEWDQKEADGMARDQGLMLSGALDALNEWAAEKYGGQLFIEDEGKILVEQAYLE